MRLNLTIYTDPPVREHWLASLVPIVGGWAAFVAASGEVSMFRRGPSGELLDDTGQLVSPTLAECLAMSAPGVDVEVESDALHNFANWITAVLEPPRKGST